jgi:hypothetical protein
MLALSPEGFRPRRPLLPHGHPERSEGSAFLFSTIRALSVSALSSSFFPAVGCELSAVNCPPPSPFPATYTSHPQIAENKTTLSPAAATLTSRVKHKSFVCHSYKKHRGWGTPPPIASQDCHPDVTHPSFGPCPKGSAFLLRAARITGHGTPATSYSLTAPPCSKKDSG